LNATIHVHYRQLIHDSEYFHTLEVMKPTFLKSLDVLASQIKDIKTTVTIKIHNDNHKQNMMSLLSNIHFHTANITGYIAGEFMAHYNKYKALASKDNVLYEADLKKLNLLIENYRIQAQKVADVSSEYNKILVIVSKLKATYDASASENADLDDLVKRVLTLLKTKNCAK